jgi:hypothetical protein
MALAPQLYDSVTPTLIPEKSHQKPNGVMCYLDGDYAWSPGTAATWDRGWWITTIGDPQKAGAAREIDVETGDATPATAAAYHKARTELEARTIVYCDLSTVEAMQYADEDWRDLWWHLAWWTGTPKTPGDIAVELLEEYGVEIAVDRILGQQYLNAAHYDQSVIFTDPRWIHP